MFRVHSLSNHAWPPNVHTADHVDHQYLSDIWRAVALAFHSSTLDCRAWATAYCKSVQGSAFSRRHISIVV